MKLNPDCIRDTLLYLEENLVIENNHKFTKITLNQLQEQLSQYVLEDVFYSVYNLHKIHFIEGKINDINDMKMFFCDINNITWNGQIICYIKQIPKRHSLKSECLSVIVIASHISYARLSCDNSIFT